MNKLHVSLPDHLKDNPFFAYSEATNFVPAWDRIRPEDAVPAMDYIFEKFRQDVEAIAVNPAIPTFTNTVEPLEEAFSNCMYYFLTLYTAMPRTEEDLKKNDKVQEQASDKFHDVFMDVFLDQRLFTRFSVLNLSGTVSKLTEERQHLFAMFANTFKVSGIMKTPLEQKQMIKLGKEISRLGCLAQTNMREAEKASYILVADRNQLAGVSETLINNAAAEATRRGHEGQWAFGIGPTIYKPFMSSAQDRSLRQQMWTLASKAATFGPHDNRATILRLMKLEHQMARIQGERNPAVQNLKYNMARNPATVEKFLKDIRKAAKPVAEAEMNVLRAFAAQEDGIKKLQPWDTDFYEEALKKRVLGYNEEELRDYFELESVVEGTLRHFEKFFNLKFTRTDEYPSYADDVRAYNVADARTGKHVGVLCMDLFERLAKPSGTAWNMSALSQGMFEGKVRRPVDMIVTKFLKAPEGKPTLLTHYDFLVLMHEMGHATHNLMSKCRYQSFSGTSVDRDFVEFPSQLQENWSFEAAVLDDVARHHVTGVRMPDALKKKLSDSRKFMAGNKVLAYAMKGWLDLAWHRKALKGVRSVAKFEREVTKDFNLAGMKRMLVSPRFSHVFGGGYGAGFYSYQWSEVMSAQLFARFKKRGLYDRGLRTAYKQALAVGGSREETETYYKLMHAHPTMRPFLKSKGLLGRSFNYAAGFTPEAAANDNAPVAMKRPLSLMKPDVA